MDTYEKLYNELLKSEELDSDFTGVWEKDKKRFIEMQDELEYLTNTPLLLDEEEQEEDFD